MTEDTKQILKLKLKIAELENQVLRLQLAAAQPIINIPTVWTDYRPPHYKPPQWSVGEVWCEAATATATSATATI